MRENFLNYIWENFELSSEAKRLIINIAEYAESIPQAATKRKFLTDILSDIGPEAEEVNLFY